MKPITVFAMTEKGYSVVAALHARAPGIIGSVVSSRDPNVAEDFFDEISSFCKNNKIIFESRQGFRTIRTEYALAVSWRWLIDAGASRLIVFHDSLLPRYRGFNPLVTSLINGDSEIGVTALYAAQDYDRGDIIARSASSILYPITIKAAITTILANYASLATRIADYLIHDVEPIAEPQRETDVSYSLWRDEEDYFIDWTASATTIRRTVDALGFPYKGAASTVDGRIVRLLKVAAIVDVSIANRMPGKVIFSHDSRPVVVCGDGLLRVDEMVDDSGTSLLPLSRFRVRFKGPMSESS